MLTDDQLLEWCEEHSYDEYLAPLLKSFDLDYEDLNALDIVQSMIGRFTINGTSYEVCDGSYESISEEILTNYKGELLDLIPSILEDYVDWANFFHFERDAILGDFAYAEEIEFNGKPYCYLEYETY